MCVSLSLCVSVFVCECHVSAGAHRGKKKVPDSVEKKLQVLVNCLK